MRRFLFALFFSAAVPALGTTVIAETIDEAVARAPIVVRATARQSQSGTDEHRIWTWTELTVTEVLKGRAPKVVLVKQPGGVVGPVGQAVAGVARFVEGEDCVLLLEPAVDEPGVLMVRALAAGKISFTTRLGAPQAIRQLAGLEFAAVAGERVRPLVKEDTLGTPEAFLARVRALVQGARR
jgi:hypothetical protein